MNNVPDKRETILITGSTGLIGSHLIKALAPRYRVIGMDINDPESRPEGWEWVQCDLTDDARVEAALKEVRERAGSHLAGVIHLAAYYDFSGDPSPLYEELTVKGSRRLIRGLRDFEVEQFIFSSSLLVMEPVQDDEEEVLTEESPTRGEWDYPRSKLEAERVLHEEHGDIPLLILRIAGVYSEDGHCVPIVHQIQRIREKQMESMFFPGDSSHGQPFVHIDDVVECICQAMERRKELPKEEVLLIAEPTVISYRELQYTIGDLIHGKQWPTIQVPASAAKAVAWAKEKLSKEEKFIRPWMIDMADDHYPVEISRANELLQWHPKHRILLTLPEMIVRLERDPKAWYERHGLQWPETPEPSPIDWEVAKYSEEEG